MKTAYRNPFFKHYGKKALAVLQTGWWPATAGGRTGLNATIRKILDWHTGRVGVQGKQPGLRRAPTVANAKRPASGQPGERAQNGSAANQVSDVSLHTFKSAIESGDESRLANDPLHRLARHLFKDSLEKIERRFQATHQDSLDQLPRQSCLHPSFRDIWTGPQRHPRVTHRLAETLAKCFSSIKPPLVVVLFCGSTVTTAWGVNELIQTPLGRMLFGVPFSGEHGEFARTILAFAVGILFSSAILDFKGRLFRNIAESGAVLQGVRNTLIRHPRWMALAGVLTIVSIKTNYDGFVTLFSKQMELSSQVVEIRRQVGVALGSPEAVAAGQVDSLSGLHARLEETARAILNRFHVLPDDEREGRASSNVAYPGPRYWGKKFVINGGYEPGKHDVRHVFRDRPLARQVDYLLSSSGIDFSVPVADRIQALVSSHQSSLEETTLAVHRHFERMEETLLNRNSLLPGMNRIFFLEHYQVNKVVEQVVEEMERHRLAYDRTIAELRELTSGYVAVLERVDKSGGAHFNNYRIELKVAPKISAIEALKQHRIPLASHRSMEDLKNFFTDQYGTVWAHLILLTILALAVGMDLADLLLLAGRTARLGLQDRKSVVPALREVLEWEGRFISNCERFFNDTELRVFLPGVAMPNRRCIQDAYYRVIEEARPILRDRDDRSTAAHAVSWFRSLFLTVRIADMEGCIDRIRAFQLLSRDREARLSRLLTGIIPGLDAGQVMTVPTFHAHYQEIEKGQMRNQAQFTRDFYIAHGMAPPNGNHTQTDWEEWSSILNHIGYEQGGKALIETMIRGARRAEPATVTLGISIVWPVVPIVIPEWLKTVAEFLFHKTFMEPFPGFSHTRRRWLRGLDSLTGNDDRMKEAIRRFGSDAARIQRDELPGIEEKTVKPLLEIIQRLPRLLGRRTAGKVRCQIWQFRKIADAFEEVLSACRHLDQAQAILYNRVHGMDLEQVSRQLEPGKEGAPLIVEQLRAVEAELEASLDELRSIERQAMDSVKQRVTAIYNSRGEIHRQVIAWNMRKMSMSRAARLLPRTLTARGQDTDGYLALAVEQSDAIQSRLEQFEQEMVVCCDQHLSLLEKLEQESRSLVLDIRQMSDILGKNGSPTLFQAEDAATNDPSWTDRWTESVQPLRCAA